MSKEEVPRMANTLPRPRWKTSVGIWAFGPAGTRFVPGGYHPEVASVPVEDRLQRAVEGLGPLIHGYEFHYGTEITEANLPRIRAALGKEHDIYCICYGLVPNPRFKYGSLCNPDPALRAEALAHHKAAIDMAADVGANYIIWPGNEGYNYNFMRDYQATWGHFLEGLAAAVEHANRRGVTVFLEHKNSEPAMQILMRNVGTTLFIIYKLAAMGVDTRRLLVNMDWQHLIMNNEPLGEHAALLLREGKMGHHHANSGWGSFDDDNMTGASFLEQTIDLARVLAEGGYTGRIGFDLYPYTEDPVEAVRRSVLQWEFLVDVALRIDPERLAAARARADAVGAYAAVFEALGLTKEYEERVLRDYAAR
jgi:xylose isomerase